MFISPYIENERGSYSTSSYSRNAREIIMQRSPVATAVVFTVFALAFCFSIIS